MKAVKCLQLVAPIIVLFGLTACGSREERVSDAVQDGQKKIVAEQREASKEIGRAQLKVERAQQEVVNQKVEGIKAIGNAQAEAQEKVNEAVHE